MNRNLTLSLIGLLLGLLLVAGMSLLRPYQMRGAVIEPPRTATDFSLGDFNLQAQRGKVVVLFFGYTHCPDVCPATLDQMRQVLKNLGNSAAQVQMVFVTIDPYNDTPEVVKSYTSSFDPRILGLSGSDAELEKVWRAYNVIVIRDPRGDVIDAVFEHSTLVYVIDRKGNLVESFPTDSFVENMLADIRYLVRN